MLELLLQPLGYDYMARAIWVSALVGALCAFLSSFLILKGWSLMGDALAHAVVPGVALAYALALPYALGAFVSGMLSAVVMAVLRQRTRLREDAVIGVVFSTFFAAGLLILSLNPTSVKVQSIILGNILAISDEDLQQVVIIAAVSLTILALKWQDLKLVFFDARHAASVGLPVTGLNILFFTLLSATAVAALQTVGACLVIAMVVTPGATAYLLTDRFGRLVLIAMALGAGTSATGAYLSYYLDGATGGVIVTLQTLIFIAVFLLAPKQGRLARWRLARNRAAEV
ncbi:metal ABC transporter permease [Marinobacterium rhizophilum]|uniref:Metal ABC transporter permease n=1 Tax=Marinobacterium rhizophilum TaxID=420402 RepID=A0ABY5HPS5_9GAMM|nr:metal ABC transporter permease [Marinobacterium rhizophilum]UTW12891.1 metal ABC transporter permease [Marinobacterium rhizophilum]